MDPSETLILHFNTKGRDTPLHHSPHISVQGPSTAMQPSSYDHPCNSLDTQTLSCLVVLSCVVLCHVVSCPVMSCHVLSCLVMSCHALSCLVLSSNPTSCLVPLGDTSSLSKYWPWASTFTFHAPCIPEWLSFVEDKCWLEGWPQFYYTWRHHQSTCLNPVPKWYPFPETSVVNRHFSNHCTLALPHFVCGT